MVRQFIIPAVALAVCLNAESGAAQEILPLLDPEGETRTLGIQELTHPVWMAALSDGQGVRFLVGGGDRVFHGRDAHPVGVIRTVGPDGFTMALAEGGQVVRVPPGRPLPVARAQVFLEAVLVKTIEYRHRVLDRGERKILNGELYLAGFHGKRAILQRDLDPPSSPTAVMERRLEAIQVVEVGHRLWEIRAKDIQAAIQSGEAILGHALSHSRVDLSRHVGIGLEITTPIVTARLDRRGFVITNPRLTGRAGLQVGDRILKVNDVPIDGYGALVRVYRNLKNRPSIGMVNLLIERGERPLSLTYRVR